MSLKGIWSLVLALSTAVTAGAIEERLTMSASAGTGAYRTIGDWMTDGAVAKVGYKGGMDFVISHAAYASDSSADLLLHLDRGTPKDETGHWTVSAGPDFAVDAGRALLGDGAGSFRGGSSSSISLAPGPKALLAAGSRFRDFTLEFWLFPAAAENGEVILLWQSGRNIRGGVLPQSLSCVVAGGRLLWTFNGFFSPPGTASPERAAGRLELRSRSPLVPRVWSHHLVRFDGDTGLLEYLVDGATEATAYATPSGHEGGTVYEPAIGAHSPLRIGVEYSGLMDELRLSGRFVEKPSVKPYGRASALVVSPVADLAFGRSRLLGVEAEMKAPGTSSIEFSYRIADSWAGWRDGSPAWIPFRPGDRLPDGPRGRFVQVRAELFPDGGGGISPALSSITLRFVADEPPPPPARLAAVPKDGAVELRWTRVPEADVAGYLVYYGDSPGEYFGTGADQGPSPIDAGDTTTIIVTGIPNGRLLYFAVAAYDAAAGATPGGAAARAGRFSPEGSARPSRTAK